MRVGYAIGPKPVLAKMTVCKQGQDVHTNIWSQVLCYRFMTEYDFDAHLAGLRKIYTKKRALLLDLMEKHLGAVHHVGPVQRRSVRVVPPAEGR